MSNLKGFLSKAKAMSRSTLSVVLVLCLLMVMIPTALLVAADTAWDGTTIATSFAGGIGTESDPYQIATAEQLAFMAQEVNAGRAGSNHFKLTADIDLGDKQWTPIGTREWVSNQYVFNLFEGTFDGNGHSIKNLYINSNVCGIGFFGFNGTGAVIKNLSLEGDVTLDSNNVVGGLLGFVYGDVTVSNCTYTGKVTGNSGGSENAFVGGLLGYVSGAHRVQIDNCKVNATITSNGTTLQQGTGGFIGAMIGGANVSITDSSFSGEVNGAYGTGGFIGNVANTNTSNLTKATIVRSYSTGSINFHSGASANNNTFLGGLVGQLRNQSGSNPRPVQLIIEDSYSLATIDQTVNSSGLVGSNFAYGDAPAGCSVEIKSSFFAGKAKYPIINRGNTAAGLMNVTTENVYYQTGSATEASDLTPAADCEKSAADFGNGTVVGLLNNGRGLWAQGDTYPTYSVAPKMTNLEVDNGELLFDEGVTKYDLFFENSVTSLTVKPTVEEGTTVTVDGKAAGGAEGVKVNLTADTKTVIEVKIERNSIEKIYTINVFCGPLWNGSVAPYPNAAEENAGTKENPYKIALPEHLAYMAQQVNSGNGKAAYYELVANINLGGMPWTPIGVSGNLFAGTFDGNGYTITNMKVDKESLCGVGLFGRAGSGALIKDVSVEGDVKLAKENCAAGIVGYVNGHATIENCTFAGTVVTESRNETGATGAIVGYANGAYTVVIDNCHADATITCTTTSSDWVQGTGGIIGMMANGIDAIIADSSFTGTINSVKGLGGLIGTIRQGASKSDPTTATIKRSYSAGTINVADTNGGGLVGQLRIDKAQAEQKIQLTILDSYSVADVVLAKPNATASGLVGCNYNWSDDPASCSVEIKNSFFAGKAKYPIVHRGTNQEALPGEMAVTTENVYYLAGSATEASDLTPAATCEKSATEFTDNTVLNLLNAGRNVWIQAAAHPVPQVLPKLNNIELNRGVFTFSSIVDDYDVYVSSKYNTITVTPTAEDPAITIKVNGNSVVSGQASAPIALAKNATTDIKVEVTRGTATMTYTIHVILTDGWDGTCEPFDTSNDAGSDIENPIYIKNAAQLAFFSAMVNGEDVVFEGKTYTAPAASGGRVYRGTYFEITADIALNDVSNYANWDTVAPRNRFEPIGHYAEKEAEARAFGGVINGNDHKIVGLYVNDSSYGAVSGVGMFGSVAGSTLRNIHVENGYVVGQQRVGGIVGRPTTEVIMQNCSFSGLVRGTFVHVDHYTIAGGLIGEASSAKVVMNSCWTEGTVIGGNAVGGLIGQIYMYNGAEIKNSYSTMTADVGDGFTSVGGLIGYLTGQAGNLEVYRSHFAGYVPTSTPFIGKKNPSSAAVVTASDTVYYRADSYEGEIDSTAIFDAVEKSVAEFADGTVTDLLNEEIAYGDYWKWETGENGYPVSDGVLLITDYRTHTDDSNYDDGNWYEAFENKPGGTLKDPNNNKGDSDDDEDNDTNDNDDDYTNSATGEKSIYIAVLILAFISAISAFLLARRKRSVN